MTGDDRLPVICMVVNCGELAVCLVLLDMEGPAIFCCRSHYPALTEKQP